MTLSHAPHIRKNGVVPSHSTSFFQPQLTVNTPGDAYEQEADQVADRVMGMQAEEVAKPQALALTPVAPVQRQCIECEKEELQRQEEEGEEKEVHRMPMASSADDTIQRQCAACEQEEAQRKESSSGDAGGKAAPGIVSDVLSSGGGQAMDTGTRQFMESRFGHDFGQVRIHTDSRAAESASAIQARAYTSGRDIVFGAGQYQPDSEGGKRLLAHELAHVGQQGGGGVVKRVAGVDDAAAGLTIGAVLSWCLSGAAISVLLDQIIQMGGWVADRLSTGSWNIRQNWCRTIFSALFGCVFGMVGGPAARLIFGEVAAFSLAQLGRWVYQKLIIWGFTMLAGRWGAMIAMSGCAESEEPAPITPPN